MTSCMMQDMQTWKIMIGEGGSVSNGGFAGQVRHDARREADSNRSWKTSKPGK